MATSFFYMTARIVPDPAGIIADGRRWRNCM
jgi:hypothetical protein